MKISTRTVARQNGSPCTAPIAVMIITLARIAAVALDHNFITGAACSDESGGGGNSVPETGSTLLLVGAGLAGLLALGRRSLA